MGEIMNYTLQVLQCIEEIAVLKSKMEGNSSVKSGRFDGEFFDSYVKLREQQLRALDRIQSRLMNLLG